MRLKGVQEEKTVKLKMVCESVPLSKHPQKIFQNPNKNDLINPKNSRRES